MEFIRELKAEKTKGIEKISYYKMTLEENVAQIHLIQLQEGSKKISYINLVCNENKFSYKPIGI